MKQFVAGVDIGGTRTKVGLADLSAGKVVDMIVSATEREDAVLFISNLHQQYLALLDKSGIKKSQVTGLGIGAPGFVYHDGSVDSTFGFLPFMDRHYQLKNEIEQRFNLPCRVDNDARVVALGEALFGRGKGFSRVLVMTLGTGLGIGLVANGRFETTLPYAHLGGHITIASSDVVCYCGRSGCMEALVSATGITEAATRAGWALYYPEIPLSAESVFVEALNGNSLAATVIMEFINHLSTGISSFVTIFAPDIIIIGGGVSKSLAPYLDMISKIKYLPPYSTYRFEIALSQLDELSGILGSAALFKN